MKKIICTLLSAVLLITSVFGASKKSLDLEPIAFEIVEEQGIEFKYVVDPRVEVMATICRLAGYPDFSRNYNGDNAYLTQIDTLMAKYSKHAAVKSIKKYQKKNISGGAWLNLAYHIKPDFSGTIVDLDPYPVDLNPELKVISAKDLNSLVKDIHDFAKDTNFSRIYTLYRGSMIADVAWFLEDVEKALIHSWGQDCFNLPEVNDVTMNISRLCAGSCFFDYVTGADGKRTYFLSVYPSVYYYDIICCYACFYTQLYAGKNWDIVKDNYIKFTKNRALQMYPESEKEIKKWEIYSDHLAYTLASIFYLDYCDYRAGMQDEENIEKYGDYGQAYESYFQSIEKEYGEVGDRVIELLDKYIAEFDDFTSFEDELNTFINGIPVSD